MALVEIGGQTMTQAQFDAARAPLLDPPGAGGRLVSIELPAAAGVPAIAVGIAKVLELRLGLDEVSVRPAHVGPPPVAAPPPAPLPPPRLGKEG